MKVFLNSFIVRAAAIGVIFVGANVNSPQSAHAASLDMQIQMVNAEIARLTAERDQKMAQLQSCAKSVNGFKIAGVTTLALTGVGIGINIAEHNTISKLNDQIDATKAEIARAEREKAKQAEMNRLTQELAAQQQQLQQAINDAKKTQQAKVEELTQQTTAAAQQAAVAQGESQKQTAALTQAKETLQTLQTQTTSAPTTNNPEKETEIKAAEQEVIRLTQVVQISSDDAAQKAAAAAELQRQRDQADQELSDFAARSASVQPLPTGGIPQLAVSGMQSPPNITLAAQVPMTDKERKKALEEINKKEAMTLKTLNAADKADTKAESDALKSSLGQVNAAKREMSNTISDVQRQQMDDLLKRRYPDLIGAQELSPQEKEELGWLLLQAQQDQAAYGAQLDAKVKELKGKIADVKNRQKQSDNQYKLDMAKNKLDGRTISEGIAMNNLAQFQLSANPTSAEINQGMNLVKKAESEISDLDYEVAPWRNNAEANWLSAADLAYLRGLDARITVDRNTVGQRRAEFERAQRAIDTQQMQDRLKDVRDTRQENINKALGL